jgi:alkanesulfonate monooxygenase SsuD/methylene tetrahydromethanopterin reductase-like flavin-dependent oxidoreductase (luciferase family)
MRVPGKSPEQIAAQYRCAIEMAQYLDRKGGFSIAVSEHHCSEDGYIPAPLMLASSMAAVTENIGIMVAATLLPLYDPVRLAGEMVVLDYIGRGRVSYVLAIGYRPEEYELFGLDFAERGAIADEKLRRLIDTFDHAHRAEVMPRLTPAPFSGHRPTLFWGGGSKPAARRAGRNGLGFIAQNAAPGLEEAYVQACREAGHEPGLCMIPPPAMPAVVFVADDVDRGWDELGPHLLADATSYADWNRKAGLEAATLSHQSSIAALREEQGNYRVVDVAGAVELVKQWGRLPLHPLCGGCPPNTAWPYLRRVAEEVLPAVARQS